MRRRRRLRVGVCIGWRVSCRVAVAIHVRRASSASFWSATTLCLRLAPCPSSDSSDHHQYYDTHAATLHYCCKPFSQHGETNRPDSTRNYGAGYTGQEAIAMWLE